MERFIRYFQMISLLGSELQQNIILAKRGTISAALYSNCDAVHRTYTRWRTYVKISSLGTFPIIIQICILIKDGRS